MYESWISLSFSNSQQLQFFKWWSSTDSFPFQAAKALNLALKEKERSCLKAHPTFRSRQKLSTESRHFFGAFCACPGEKTSHHIFLNLPKTGKFPLLLQFDGKICCGLMTSQMNNLLQRQPNVMRMNKLERVIAMSHRKNRNLESFWISSWFLTAILSGPRSFSFFFKLM